MFGSPRCPPPPRSVRTPRQVFGPPATALYDTVPPVVVLGLRLDVPQEGSSALLRGGGPGRVQQPAEGAGGVGRVPGAGSQRRWPSGAPSRTSRTQSTPQSRPKSHTQPCTKSRPVMPPVMHPVACQSRPVTNQVTPGHAQWYDHFGALNLHQPASPVHKLWDRVLSSVPQDQIQQNTTLHKTTQHNIAAYPPSGN